jgi:antitoxin component of MazEF toxin-antitoxin module
MLFSMLRTVGGSVMFAIPKPILDGLGLSANTHVGLSVSGGRLIVEPHPRPRYTLSELVLVPHELNVAANRREIDLEVPRQNLVGWPFPRSRRLVDRLHPPHQRPRAGLPHRRHPRSPASLAVATVVPVAPINQAPRRNRLPANHLHRRSPLLSLCTD